MSETTPATSLSIAIPDPAAIVSGTSPIELRVSMLKITDEASHAEGLELGKRIRGMQKLVKDMYAAPKKSAHEHHKLITSTEAKYLQPLETQNLLASKLSEYEAAERRRADEEARVRQAEANRIEQERTLLEAVAAEEAGDQELAEAIVEAPVSAAVVLPAPKLAEVAGASSRTTWKADVTDLQALVNYVSKNPESINLLEANMTALNGLARALKENLRIPGVRSVSDTVRSYRD